MGDKIYLGTLLGSDGKYYKPVFARRPKMIDENYAGRTLMSMAIDEGFLYVGDISGASGHIYMYSKDNLSNHVAISDNYGSQIKAIAIKGNFIYFGGLTKQTVNKRDKKKLNTPNTNSSNYGGTILAIAVDDNDFVYIGGATTNKVWKLNSLLSKVAESVTLDNEIKSIICDDNYLYVATANYLYKLNNTTLAKIKEVEISISSNLVLDNGYIFASTGSQLIKINPNDLLIVDSFPTDNVKFLSINDKYIYTGAGQAITQWKKDTMLNLGTTPNVGYSLNAMCADGTAVFANAYSDSKHGFIRYDFTSQIIGYEEV